MNCSGQRSVVLMAKNKTFRSLLDQGTDIEVGVFSERFAAVGRLESIPLLAFGPSSAANIAVDLREVKAGSWLIVRRNHS